eukprot:gene24623-32066_t
MGGQVLFQDALAARLDLIKPSKSDVATFLQKNPLKLTKGVKRVVDLLHTKGVYVYLVSGGFRQMINPVAESLNIPLHRIYANNLLFNQNTGSFAGFDLNEPTSRDGGKPAVINQNVVMIGDGVTDMQAKPPAALFIGFGGVVVREKVRDGADWFISDFSGTALNSGALNRVELIDILEAGAAE